MNPTVKDQVSMMFGKEVADTLDAEGLLASWSDKLKPWQYRVRVKDTGLVVLPIDRGIPRVPRNLGRETWAVAWPSRCGSTSTRTISMM